MRFKNVPRGTFALTQRSIYDRTSGCRLFGRFVGDALNHGAQTAQLALEVFVAAIDVVDALHFGLAFGELDPQLEHFCSADMQHVAGDVCFGVFPDDEAVGKG